MQPINEIVNELYTDLTLDYLVKVAGKAQINRGPLFYCMAWVALNRICFDWPNSPFACNTSRPTQAISQVGLFCTTIKSAYKCDETSIQRLSSQKFSFDNFGTIQQQLSLFKHGKC
jgi:hypothetical protein